MQIGSYSNLEQSLGNHIDADFETPLYNVWTFTKKTNGVTHFGNSEQRILDNLLYLYTEPFDIVLDPFAGGGSTIDVCKRRLRRYWASDRKPTEARRDIRTLDIGQELPPLNRRWSEVTLTYLDPPYWRQAARPIQRRSARLRQYAADRIHRQLTRRCQAHRGEAKPWRDRLTHSADAMEIR